MSRRNRSRIRQAISEVLESRRLFSTVVNGTPGPDTITMTFDGTNTAIKLNGVQVVNTIDNAFIINGNGGDDDIHLDEVGAGKSVTVRGGLGNDHVQSGVGNYGRDVHG